MDCDKLNVWGLNITKSLSLCWHLKPGISGNSKEINRIKWDYSMLQLGKARNEMRFLFLHILQFLFNYRFLFGN